MSFNYEHSIKIKKLDLENGVAVVRLSWDSLTWRKMKVESVDLFNGLTLVPVSAYIDKGTKYRTQSSELGKWLPVETITPEEQNQEEEAQ